jgi:peptidyl-prolyl cis-trans isomerase C
MKAVRSSGFRVLSLAALALLLLAGSVPAAVSKAPRAKPARARVVPRPATSVPEDSVLARVGNRIVTVADFRREWNRSLERSRTWSTASLADREQFLEDLVTRHLLATEAVSKPGKLSPAQEAELAALRERLLRNTLFQTQVVDPARNEDVDFDALRAEISKFVGLKGYLFDTRESAQAWYTRLVSGTPAARLEAAAEAGGPGAPRSFALGFRSREDLSADVSHVVFRLGPGRWSQPVPYQSGWGLFQVTGERKRPPPVDVNDLQALRDEALRLRSADLREEFRRRLADELALRYSDAAIDTIVNRFLLLPPRVQPNDEGGQVVSAFVPVPKLSAADSSLVLATSKRGVVTGASLMKYLTSLSAVERPEVRSHDQLVPWVDRVAFDTELLQRAEKLGLDRDPRVRDELDRRREGFLVEMLYADSVKARVIVPEDSLRAIFAADSARFSIREAARIWACIVERRSLADSILQRARAGSDLKELAQTYSIVPQSAGAGGMSGWFSPGESENHELEALVFASPVGHFGGPLNAPEGWVVFQVIEKRPAEGRTYKEARPDVVATFAPREEERLLQGLLQRMRRRVHVESHPERLIAVVPSGKSATTP